MSVGPVASPPMFDLLSALDPEDKVQVLSTNLSKADATLAPTSSISGDILTSPSPSTESASYCSSCASGLLRNPSSACPSADVSYTDLFPK